VPRKPASITQADIQRAIRAARAEGVAVVEIRVGGATIIIPLSTDSSPTKALAEPEEIVL
jgi:chitinase